MDYIIENDQIWSAHRKEIYIGFHFPVVALHEKITKLNQIVYKFPHFKFIGELSELFKVAKQLNVIVNLPNYFYYEGEYYEIHINNKEKMFKFVVSEINSDEPNKELIINIINCIKQWT